MIANYTNIIKQLSPTVPIIISAVLPIDDEVRGERRGWNQRITAFNQDLKTLALKSKNVSFMDTGRLLMDANGNLADQYHDGNGIHLNAKGNGVWIAELRKTIKNAQQNVAGN
jgi:lysophospholipase L1-like esterase